jgi:large subunit ribosomal protein L10
MENPRPDKVAVVDEVREKFDEADAAILTEYRGLKVKELADLRRALRVNGGEYKVYKNTLIRLATNELGLGELDPMLEGPTAIAFVKGDAAAVAKSLRDFSRTNALLVLKGGVLGKKVINAGETAALAELPSRDVLLARIAGGLAAPLQQFAGLLQALPRNLAFGLAALRDQRLAAGETLPTPEADTAPECAAPEAAVEEAPAAEAPAAEAPAPDAAVAEAEEAPVPEAAEPEAVEPEAAVPETEAAESEVAAPEAAADEPAAE